jgi:hypothetical protein
MRKRSIPWLKDPNVAILHGFPHQPLQSEYLDCEESARKPSATGFDSMTLDPEGHISER